MDERKESCFPFLLQAVKHSYIFKLARAQSGVATGTNSVLLITVTGLIRQDFVTYCWLSELPHLSLLAATGLWGSWS